MTWRLGGSEARVEFVLIQTYLLFIWKSCCSYANFFLSSLNGRELKETLNIISCSYRTIRGWNPGLERRKVLTWTWPKFSALNFTILRSRNCLTDISKNFNKPFLLYRMTNKDGRKNCLRYYVNAGDNLIKSVLSGSNILLPSSQMYPWRWISLLYRMAVALDFYGKLSQTPAAQSLDILFCTGNLWPQPVTRESGWIRAWTSQTRLIIVFTWTAIRTTRS